MPSIRGNRKKKFKTNPKIEAALKEIRSYRLNNIIQEGSPGEKDRDDSPSEKYSAPKSTAEKLDDLAILHETLQISKESYETQRDAILVEHLNRNITKDALEELNGNIEINPCPPSEKSNDYSDIIFQNVECATLSSSHLSDRSSSSPTQDSEQGSMGPMGLFREEGVYKTRNDEEGDSDDQSNDSDTPIKNATDSEQDDGSLSSNESEEWDNEMEILAMKNKEKNKDILRELYLDEIEGRPITPLVIPNSPANSGTSSTNGGPPSALKTTSPKQITRTISSVDFSDHDVVQEFEKDEAYIIAPLNMDPNEIYLNDNSETGLTEEHGSPTLKRNPSFIKPEYTKPSKKSLQKAAKKGGFLAALKKKKTATSNSTDNTSGGASSTTVGGEKSSDLTTTATITNDGTGKEILRNSNKAEEDKQPQTESSQCLDKLKLDVDGQDAKVQDDSSHNSGYNQPRDSMLLYKDSIKKSMEQRKDNDSIQKSSNDSPSNFVPSSDENRMLMKENRNCDLPKISELRDSVSLSLKPANGPNSSYRKVGGGEVSISKDGESSNSDVGVTKADIITLPPTEVLSPRHDESTRDDDGGRNTNMLPELTQQREAFNRRGRSPPRKGSLIEHSDEATSSTESSVLPESQSAKFKRLTQPKVYTSPSVELAKPPPEMGTRLLELPCSDLRILIEKCQDEKHFILHLDPSEEKLRVKVKATESSHDWEYSNKFSYFGLNFNRTEFMEFEEEIIRQRQPDEKSFCREQETCANGRIRPDRIARGLTNTHSTAENKKKLLISHDDAFDFLYINRMKLLRKVRPHLAQMDTFCRRYFIGFLCLVFDLKMQLLGTYDHKLGKYFPGVVVCPPHNQRQKRRRDNHRYSNILEIDFNKLPVDTFAVVPVVCDVSPRTAEFPGVHLQLDVAVNSTEENIRRAFESVSKFDDSDSQMSSVEEQFDVQDAWEPPIINEHMTVKLEESVLPAHVDFEFVDKNWTHVESFFLERASTLPIGVGDGPQYSINYNQTRCRTVPLNNRSSYVPFILYRRYDYSSESAATGERLWSMKGVQETFEGILPHVVARNALRVMKNAFVVPVHHINVEHCMNCDKHKSTTWHVPGSYEKRFEDLAAAIQTSLPPCIVTSNKFTTGKDKIPRIGSFDITVRPFFSSITQLMHSKVISKQFPTPNKLVADLATLLLPEKITFKGVHTLELHVYDGYNRIPLKGVNVKLYRVEIIPSKKGSLTGTLEEWQGKRIPEEKTPEVKRHSAINNWILPSRKAERQAEEESTEKHKGLPQIPRDSVAYKKKRDLGKGFTALMLESKSLPAARMRHSKSFFNVRTWRKEEVARWIKSYGLPDEVVQAAAFDGAVDGPSFLSIANADAFQRWGIKSRIKLGQMQKSLDELKQEHTGNMVTSYDPYTYNELLEGAADRHAPSPLYSEPANPRESMHIEDVTYHVIGSKKTGSRGLCFMNVDLLGSYILRIESALFSSYCSHVFQINAAGHSAFCASLNPKIGLVKFRVAMENGINEEIFEGADESGILISMVNLHNGKRHIAVVKIDQPERSTTHEEKESLWEKNKRLHSSQGNLVSDRKVNTGDKNSSPHPKRTIQRQSSAGTLLMNNLLNRKSAHSGRSRASVLEKNTSANKSMMESTKILTFYCTGEIYLPVGKYYSEVDGAVFSVEAMQDDTCSDETWSNMSREYLHEDDSRNIEASSTSADYIDYTEAQTRKCHRRIVMSSVRAFQKIYRRYKKNFLRDNIWAYLTLKRSFRVVLKRIRATIATRHAVRIQRHYRMWSTRRKYLAQKEKAIVCASIMRRYIARKLSHKVFCSTQLIKKFVRGWLRRRALRRYNAALAIQLLFRRVIARTAYVNKLFERRLKKRARRYVAYVRKQILLRKEVQDELHREHMERLSMDGEYQWMIDYLREKDEYEKRAIRQKVQQLEKKLSKKATIVQKHARGFGYRIKLMRITKSVIVLQKRFRLHMFEEQLKRQPKNLKAKQRFVAYCPSFPFLNKHPQLLGGTKLLMGMYKGAARSLESQKEKEDEESITSSEFKSERRRSFVDSILHKVLDSPATKIISVMLMYRDRTRYIAHSQDIYGTDFQPPLFRFLTSVPDHEVVSSEVVMNKENIDNVGNITGSYDNKTVQLENEKVTLKPMVLKSLAGFLSRSPTPSPGMRNDSPTFSPAGSPLKNADVKTQYDESISPDENESAWNKDNRNEIIAAIIIQKLFRGYLVRAHSVGNFNDDVGACDDGLSGITKVSVAKNPFAFTRQLSDVSQTVSRTLKRGLSTASMKSTSKVRELTRSVSSGISRVQSASSLMKEKLEEKAEVKREFKAQQAVQQERLNRLKKHEVNVEDAILHITGWDESQLPRLNRKWYVCAFPLLAGEGPEKVMRKNKFTETNFYQNVLSKNSETYEEENEHLEYEMSNNRFPGEAVRTCDLAPLSRESFEKLNFNIHLADYLCYTRVHIVVYIQTGEEGGMDESAVRPDALPRDTSVPTIRELVIDKEDRPAYFLPAFHGTVTLNQGKAFPPSGGRLNLNLTPIPNQAIYLSRAQAKRIALMKGIRIAATLFPVAVPTASFLYSLMCKQTPPPTYPSEIFDVLAFEKHELDLKEFYGAALCMVRFKNRNLVSARHRGVPHGVLEFDGDGEVVGKAIEHQDSIGTITSMIAGFEHLLCCGSTGVLAVYMQNTKEIEEEFSIAPSSYSQASRNDDERLLTCVRALTDVHKVPVTSCASVHRAGMDIFFTLDKSDNIGVIVMEKGVCLRSFLNECFVTYHITSFVVSLDRLYLGLTSGIVVTINLSEIMNGNVNAAGNLNDHILGRDAIFSREAGISTMSIMSQHDFLGCYNEDTHDSELVDVPKSGGGIRKHSENDQDSESDSDEDGCVRSKNKNGSRLQKLKRAKLHGESGGNMVVPGEIPVNPKCVKLPNPALEGHVILVAGGDKDPRIKVLLPLYNRKRKEKDRVDDPDIGFGFREVYALRGHDRATTQMVVDAAGRFIVTVSQGSRQMRVWNALSENCEITHDNVNAAHIGLSNNALFFCSFKAPFLTIWKPKPQEGPKKRYRKKIEMDDGRYRYEELEKDAPSVDGRPEIGFVRANVWCMNTIQGGMKTPNRSLAETDFFLGGNGRGRQLVEFWRRYFDRGVKTVSKLAPKLPEKATPPRYLNPKGALSKGLRSKFNLQRRLEQQKSNVSNLTTTSMDYENNDSPQGFDSRPEFVERNLESFNSDADHENYNSYYGCYYDHAGNPYNYDENGNLYYYYGTSNNYVSDTSVKEMSGYDLNGSELEKSSVQEITDQFTEGFNRLESFNTITEQPSVEEFGDQPSVDNISADSSAQYGVEQSNGFSSANYSQEMLPAPQSSVFYDESYRTSSQYEEGFNDDSYDENFSANNGLEFNQTYGSFSPVNTTSVISSHLLVKGNESLDSYGFSKNPQVEAENDNDFVNLRGSSSQSNVTQSNYFLKRNPLSRRRRHMHMSDSDESEDEKLSSIYKVKRTEIKLRKEMEAKLAQLDPNAYGYDVEANNIRRAYGFEEITNESSIGLNDSNAEDDFDDKLGGVNDGYSGVIQEDSRISGHTDDTSVISISNERKKMLAKRKQLLSRRILHEIDGEESD